MPVKATRRSGCHQGIHPTRQRGRLHPVDVSYSTQEEVCEFLGEEQMMLGRYKYVKHTCNSLSFVIRFVKISSVPLSLRVRKRT